MRLLAERALPDHFAESAHEASDRARQDIGDEWMPATDAANLHPDVRPLFRTAADHMRMHPAEGMSLEERDHVADALEAPWGIRRERVLRAAFTRETAGGGETTRNIAGVVKELGLQPWKAPEPLDPIDLGEIDLVVWMRVTGEAPPPAAAPP